MGMPMLCEGLWWFQDRRTGADGASLTLFG
jgi:hypothetical protein